MVKLNKFFGGKDKAVTMSYDDGVFQDRRLVEIFNKYGIRGSFHINAGFLDTGNKISKAEVADLYKNHEVSVHGYTHMSLSNTCRESIVTQIVDDRKALEDLVGYPVRGMSYAYGHYNKEVIDILKSLGIEYSRTTETTNNFQIPDDFLAWKATCHHNKELLNNAEKFLEVKPRFAMNLMYVWGHSYEFDNNNNWDLIEEFCRLVSGKNDIWYATNIEIVDYVTAIKALRFSMDSKMVYNPSAISCWISYNDNTVEIPSGKIIKLD